MIFLGADHGGFSLKEQVKLWLSAGKYEFEDCGAKTLDPGDDYPPYAFAVAQNVSRGGAKGILFCRSSGGMVIAANKVQGIRAVAAWDEKSAKHAREHNDANIIAIAGDWMDYETAEKIIRIFLTTEFSNEERHSRRINQIMDYEMQWDWGACCGGGCCQEEK
jgi:ribose 5-phosphate isomerase B